MNDCHNLSLSFIAGTWVKCCMHSMTWWSTQNTASRGIEMLAFFSPYFGAAKVPSCYYSCLKNAMVLVHMQVSDRLSCIAVSLVFGIFFFFFNLFFFAWWTPLPISLSLSSFLGPYASLLSHSQVMRSNHGEDYTIRELNPVEWTFDDCPKVSFGIWCMLLAV